MMKNKIVYYCWLFFTETIVFTLLNEIFRFLIYGYKDFWTISHAFQDAMTWAILRSTYMFILGFVLFVILNKVIKLKNMILKVTIINTLNYLLLCLIFSILIPFTQQFYDLKFGFFYYTIFAVLISPSLLSIFKLKPPTFTDSGSNFY